MAWGLMVMLLTAAAAAAADRPLRTVPVVDLKRYAGKWYEIARFPNRFQRNCVSDVTATYTLKPDGGIAVVNACKERDGSVKTASGSAKLRDRNGPASQLRVTFFWPFYGDYQIIELDPEYRWALVGTPSRDYLWVLSRTPVLDKAAYDSLLRVAKEQGFGTERMVLTPQNP